jgi:Spy/CpxP family protein refolding chaperone
MIDRTKSRFKTWLVLVVIFVLGAVTGVGLGGVYRSKSDASFRDSPGRHREALFEKMRTDLNLTAEQSKEMRKVLDETGNEFRALRSELRPRYEELRMKTRGRMRALLTQDQQGKFDSLMAEIDARRQREGGTPR